jgi:glyoxylase-like metal-dependent hydrolase (beta-lactamase superfamily II)
MQMVDGKRSWLALAAGLVLSGTAGAQQQDFDAVVIEAVPVAEGLYMLVGSGGNIGVSVGADGVLIVDDQYAPLTAKIRAAIAKLTDQPVRMVLNTHWHGDHTGGNENFAGTGALIVAHDNVRVRMSASYFSEFFQTESPPSPDAALPVVTFDSTVSFHLNGQRIRAEHVPPAHTDGDSLVWFEDRNAVHMGDTYFNGFYPFIDVGSGGSLRGMIQAVDLALPRIDPQTRVIPGHGPLSNRAELVEYRTMLATVADRLQALKAAGKSLDEVIAAKPTAEFDARWGQGFIGPDRWVGLVYRAMGP